MKRVSRLALLTVLILLPCLLAGCSGKKPKEIRDIRKFRFTYSCGMQMTDQVAYTLEKTGEGYTATVKPQGIDPEQPLSVAVDEAFVQEVEELLRKNRVEKWYGFNKRARNIMDGIGFTLYVTMENGTEVDAVGYMRWPEHYGAVEGGLDSLFMGLWEASGREMPPGY